MATTKSMPISIRADVLPMISPIKILIGCSEKELGSRRVVVKQGCKTVKVRLTVKSKAVKGVKRDCRVCFFL